jgi:hypothetical protein
MKNQKTSKCLSCGKEKKYYRSRQTGKYCNNKCQIRYQNKERIYNWIHKGISWSSREIPPWPPRYLLQVQDGKCNRCDCKLDQIGRPLTMEYNHIDGDGFNNSFMNGEMICVQCHSLTSTYKAKDRTKVTKKQQQQEAEHIKRLFEKRRIEDLPEPTIH